jgi:hypothetical protein
VPALHWLVQFLVSDQEVSATGEWSAGLHNGARSEFGILARGVFFFVFYDFRSIAKASFGRDRVCMGTAAAFI